MGLDPAMGCAGGQHGHRDRVYAAGSHLFFAYTIAGKVSAQKLGIMAQTSISFILGSIVLLIMMLIMGKPVIAE